MDIYSQICNILVIFAYLYNKEKKEKLSVILQLKSMGHNIGVLMIIAACITVIVIGAMRRRAEWILNMILRAVLGMIAIYFVNVFLAGRGINAGVGINEITFLTSAILGFPGIAALYGLGFYRLL